MNSIERGCFLIADVSGYTRYLGSVELDHAQDILADLLGAVVANTSVMRTAKLEGDAVFCHAPTGVLDGPALVDTIESCYFAFTRRRRTIVVSRSSQRSSRLSTRKAWADSGGSCRAAVPGH